MNGHGDLWVDAITERRHDSVLSTAAWRERVRRRARPDAVAAALGRERQRLLARIARARGPRRAVAVRDFVAALCRFRRQAGRPGRPAT